jgi:hypothetical protein
MAEQIESLGIFVTFPDLSNAEPSKSQLKALAKIKAAKEKKAEKKADQSKPAGETKDETKKEE